MLTSSHRSTGEFSEPKIDSVPISLADSEAEQDREKEKQEQVKSPAAPPNTADNAEADFTEKLENLKKL